jgi:5-methyltetrahydrofolate--homocysteine methyltransferase
LAEEKLLASLRDSIIDLDFNTIGPVAQQAMDVGIDPGMAITQGIVPGMAVVGDKFESGEYFLSELVVAAEVMKEGMKIINPFLKEDSLQTAKKVVIATVEGDHHDLGKNIVTTLLISQGFEVVDLGTDVSPARILAAVKEHHPEILGMSALLSLTMVKMGETIEVLKEAGLRDKVKIIVGGTPVTPEFADSIGADYRALNALEGVKKCVAWVTPGERNR